MLVTRFISPPAPLGSCSVIIPWAAGCAHTSSTVQREPRAGPGSGLLLEFHCPWYLGECSRKGARQSPTGSTAMGPPFPDRRAALTECQPLFSSCTLVDLANRPSTHLHSISLIPCTSPGLRVTQFLVCVCSRDFFLSFPTSLYHRLDMLIGV